MTCLGRIAVIRGNRRGRPRLGGRGVRLNECNGGIVAPQDKRWRMNPLSWKAPAAGCAFPPPPANSRVARPALANSRWSGRRSGRFVSPLRPGYSLSRSPCVFGQNGTGTERELRVKLVAGASRLRSRSPVQDTGRRHSQAASVGAFGTALRKRRARRPTRKCIWRARWQR